MERVWIYQSARKLSGYEQKMINADLQLFVDQWAAHHRKLKADHEILHDRFIIIKVDENILEASGCSIDESVRFVKMLEQKYNLSLFDRSKMAYVATDGKVKTASLQDIPELYKNGEVTDSTSVFNNLVQNASEMKKNWKVPFAESGFVNFK